MQLKSFTKSLHEVECTQFSGVQSSMSVEERSMREHQLYKLVLSKSNGFLVFFKVAKHK